MNIIKRISPYSLCPALGLSLVVLMLFGHNLLLEIWVLILLVCIVVLWYLKNKQKGEEV